MDEEKINTDSILEHTLNEKKKLNDRINQLTVIGKEHTYEFQFKLNYYLTLIKFNIIYLLSLVNTLIPKSSENVREC